MLSTQGERYPDRPRKEEKKSEFIKVFNSLENENSSTKI